VNPGTAHIFELPPFFSGTDKATNFKFGKYIYRVHRNKSTLKFCEKMERGRIQGLPKFFEYPILSQERVKLRTSNLAGIFTGSMRHANKSPLKIWENRERGRIQGLPNFLKYPLLSREWVKLRTSSLADIFRVSVRTKPIKNLRENGAWAYTGTAQIF